MNIIHLTGRLGADPETRTVGSTTVTELRMATSKKYKNKEGELVEKTEWHTINFWGAAGLTLEKYTKKGEFLTIMGELQYDKWEDNNGQKRTTAKIRGDRFTFVGGGGGDASPRRTEAEEDKRPSTNVPEQSTEPAYDPDNLPF